MLYILIFCYVREEGDGCLIVGGEGEEGRRKPTFFITFVFLTGEVIDCSILLRGLVWMRVGWNQMAHLCRCILTYGLTSTNTQYFLFGYARQ